MSLCSLVVQSLHPCLFSCTIHTADCIVKYGGHAQLTELRHAQCHVVQCNGVCTKGTAHTGLKEIRAKATVITLANFDVGCLKKNLLAVFWQ